MTKAKLTAHTITLSRAQVGFFVDAALSSASKDDVTPVICGAKITVTGDQAQICCTDRYRVTLAKSIVVATDDHEFIMPRAALEWLKRNANAFGRNMAQYQSFTIDTTDEGALTVTVIEGTAIESRGSLSWHGYTTKGNFPPAERLIEKARAAELSVQPVRLNLDFIAAIRSLGNRYDVPNFKFTISDNPNKPGPVLITFEHAEVIIQPNLQLR